MKHLATINSFFKNYRMLQIILLITALLHLSLSVSYAGNEVMLAWNANTDSDTAGYRVYYRTASAEAYNTNDFIDVGNSATATITNLIEGETYYFSITAYDYAMNESALSTEASTTILNQAAEESLLLGPETAPILKLDFDNTTGPATLEGWTSFIPAVYTQQIGYGWKSTNLISSRDRKIGDNLQRDFHLMSKNGDNTLLVDLANGKYKVTLYIGDPSYSYSAFDVYAEQILVLPSVTPQAGVTKVETFETEVTDGQLTVKFVLSGTYGLVNGIEITPIP
jgi:fibronectin type 3 domain-containing protein